MAYRSSSYRRRVAISVVTTATASTADVEFTPPDAWDEFWAAIDASGYGIRLTEADGVTPLTYAWSGFNKTTKAGTIQIDAAPTPSTAGKCVLYWLYYDVTSPTDGSSAVTISTPLTAALDLARPDPAQTIVVRRQNPGEDLPQYTTAKAPDAQIFVWLDFGEIVQIVDAPYNGRLSWEEPAVAEVSVVDTSGSAVASMNDETAMRWVSVRDRGRDRVLLKLRLKAGTDSTWYTLIGGVQTSTPDLSPYRTISESIGVYVRKQRRT